MGVNKGAATVPLVAAGTIKNVAVSPSVVVNHGGGTKPAGSHLVIGKAANDVSIERSNKKPLILTRPTSGVAGGANTILRFNPATGASPTVVTSNICAYCKTKLGNFLCAKCNKIRYCSASCQTNDWPSHSTKCGIKTEPTD